jgi:BMFP domain-containing protein YqiC
MEKYNKLFNKIAGLVEKGLYTSQDYKKTLEDTLKFKLENIVNKLNLVTREEFEVQKKLISKIQKELIKSKKKTTKAKKF